jgi:hypothetical protein
MKELLTLQKPQLIPCFNSLIISGGGTIPLADLFDTLALS